MWILTPAWTTFEFCWFWVLFLTVGAGIVTVFVREYVAGRGPRVPWKRRADWARGRVLSRPQWLAAAAYGFVALAATTNAVALIRSAGVSALLRERDDSAYWCAGLVLAAAVTAGHFPSMPRAK